MKPKINRSASAYVPEKYDQAQTPPWAVEPLFKYMLPGTRIWECASGEGYIARALAWAGFNVFATELDTTIPSFVWNPDRLGVNFLLEDLYSIYKVLRFGYIVTNPPYSGNMKQAFVERCYYYYHTHGIPFALLMPVEFIGTGSAQSLFAEGGGLQMIYMDKRADFRMPNIGWTGKSTNKLVMRVNKKTGKEEWVRQSGAQFPTAWYCVGFNLPRDIVFEKVAPYFMEELENPKDHSSRDLLNGHSQ